MIANLDLFSEYKHAINTAMAKTFAELPNDLEVQLSEQSLGALEKLRDYSIRPGKRIRGSLAAAAYDQANDSHLAQQGVMLGVALELMQNYLLIIDDVMDKSKLRRGMPTVHELYLLDKRLDLHEAQMMAINVGLLAQHFAALVLARIPTSPERIVQASRLLQTNITLTGFGQIEDLYQQSGRNISSKDIIQKYQLKSSYYTFINPLQIGLALAGAATKESLAVCSNFGLPAGVAFQLHDDMLGIFSEADTLGKSNLDDIREGKYTLLMHHALIQGSDDSNQLLAILGKADASEKDLLIVRKILTRSGAKSFVQDEMDRYAAEAQMATKNVIWKPGFQDFLCKLVSFSIERIK